MNYPAIFKKRIPSDIFADPMQLILNKEKAAANQSSEYQKKQEIKKSTTNIIVILKSIETQSQNQIQNQIQNQSQNQTKTYAQAATTNVEENNLQQTKKQQKQQEKEKEKEKYREKRLVIQVDKEIAKNIDSYTLRNQINDRFFVKENINSSIIATITKSFTSQSIIFTRKQTSKQTCIYTYCSRKCKTS